MRNNANEAKSALASLREELSQYHVPIGDRKVVFFKTGPGGYAEHDQFLGVSVPHLRKIAKRYYALTLTSVVELIESPINEERLLALFILIHKYQQDDATLKEQVYHLYQNKIKHINNWNLVDASAHLIVGAYLYQKDKNYLLDLAASDNLWARRIAIISTLYFIRHNRFDWTIKIAEQLILDTHDLIHKAVGWMLREMGKREETSLITFLERHAAKMPRTMLRYAIEKLTIDQKRYYMKKK